MRTIPYYIKSCRVMSGMKVVLKCLRRVKTFSNKKSAAKMVILCLCLSPNSRCYVNHVGLISQPTDNYFRALAKTQAQIRRWGSTWNNMGWRSQPSRTIFCSLKNAQINSNALFRKRYLYRNSNHHWKCNRTRFARSFSIKTSTDNNKACTNAI